MCFWFLMCCSLIGCSSPSASHRPPSLDTNRAFGHHHADHHRTGSTVQYSTVYVIKVSVCIDRSQIAEPAEEVDVVIKLKLCIV